MTSTPDKPRSDSEAPHSTAGRGTLFGGLISAVVGAAVMVPLILAQNMRGRGASDQINYHEKVIRTFAAQLPTPDLSDYLSATTPGYHLLLAVFARGVSDARAHLQLAGLAFTLALLALVGACVARWSGSWRQGALLALPLAASLYVVSAGAWLLPDNAAWLCVAAILALLVRGRGVTALALAGVVLVGLVAFRQIHVWAAGVIWAAGWLRATLPVGESRTLLDPRDLVPEASRGGWKGWAANVTLAVGVTVPAWALLAWFYRLWDGHLTPPTFVAWYSPGVQWATPAFVLSLLGIVGVFCAGWVWPGLVQAVREHRLALALGVGLGLVAVLAPDTTYDFRAGRFSGIWNGVRMAPVLGGRTSVVLLVLAPLGAACVVGWLAGMDRRARWVMLAALAGFAAAQAASEQLWQRYHEPFVLIWAAYACALRREESVMPAVGRLRVAGPAALALVLGAVTAWSIARAGVATDHGFEPGRVEASPDAPSSGAGPEPGGMPETTDYHGR